MQVVKRNGSRVAVDSQRILDGVKAQCLGLSDLVDPQVVADAVISGVHDNITTARLDELASETAAYMALHHPDYSKLAARIAIKALHKVTKNEFSDVVHDLYTYTDAQGRSASLIADDVYEFVMANKEVLNAAIVHANDFEYSFFGFKTLERSYLLKIDGKIAERPQHMIMRVACGIHAGNVADALNTYELMSNRFFTHATPTLFNAGTRRPQMSSCFLLANKDDSIDGIFDTLAQCARISKYAGGIGVAMHNVRATGSYIKGTNGNSNGIVPMLRVFNETARYVDQGGGKRKGSIAVYLEPWHDDIMDFLQLRKNHGKEDRRCRDLFQGLWVPDLFMKRVEEDGDWTLMCPNECPGLYDVWGEQFEKLYTQYEREGKGRRTIKAQNLWFQILDSQIETGLPYLLYKDQCNAKSNQQNIGTIKSSNLCTEILEYTDADEVAVCNLASIALPMFVKRKTPLGETLNLDDNASVHADFDFEKLRDVTKTITRNLNKVIDRNFYPVPEAKRSNMRHRPIGLGVQGLADALQMLRLPYESNKARALNRHIFETIYFAAVEASVELAEKEGHYETFPGSPASKGLFQFDMWTKDLASAEKVKPDSGLWNWEPLRERMVKFGMRNSLLVAPMPTASTSQILNNNESFEPYSSNVYVRRVLSGEFIVVNPHLLNDLIERGLWNENVRKMLIADNGSVQNMPGLPDDLRELYKTVWEIKQRAVIDQAAERGAFIDQSQSLNLYVGSPNYSKLSSMHFYGWRKGLKTGCYYLRTRAAADPIKFTVDVAAQQQLAAQNKSKTAEAAVPKPAEVPEPAKDEEMQKLKAQLSNSLIRRTSRMDPEIEEESSETQQQQEPLSALEQAKASAMLWKKPKQEPEGECTMCSG